MTDEKEIINKQRRKMKQISTQQLSALVAYLKGQPWDQVHPLITMLSSLPTVEPKKDTPVTPKK